MKKQINYRKLIANIVLGLTLAAAIVGFILDIAAFSRTLMCLMILFTVTHSLVSNTISSIKHQRWYFIFQNIILLLFWLPLAAFFLIPFILCDLGLM